MAIRQDVALDDLDELEVSRRILEQEPDGIGGSFQPPQPEVPMKRLTFVVVLGLVCVGAAIAQAQRSRAELVAEAESAAPDVISKNATIKTADGMVLRAGTNGWTCYPGSAAIGPMCNEPQWDAALAALMKRERIDVKEFSISYMLAGEGEAIGVSNTDPFATDPAGADDWVKEGPHLMILVPDPAILEGLSTNAADPVYVMWKGTPYAHIMVKIAEER